MWNAISAYMKMVAVAENWTCKKMGSVPILLAENGMRMALVVLTSASYL